MKVAWVGLPYIPCPVHRFPSLFPRKGNFLTFSLRLALSLSLSILILYVTLLPIVAPEILEASYPQGNILTRTGAILGLLAVLHCPG